MRVSQYHIMQKCCVQFRAHLIITCIYGLLKLHGPVRLQIGGNLATPCTWHNCSFSPKNSSMVCTGGSYGLVFWKVQVVNDHKLQRINAVIGSREDAAEDGNASGFDKCAVLDAEQPRSCCWQKQRNGVRCPLWDPHTLVPITVHYKNPYVYLSLP